MTKKEFKRLAAFVKGFSWGQGFIDQKELNNELAHAFVDEFDGEKDLDREKFLKKALVEDDEEEEEEED